MLTQYAHHHQDGEQKHCDGPQQETRGGVWGERKGLITWHVPITHPHLQPQVLIVRNSGAVFEQALQEILMLKSEVPFESTGLSDSAIPLLKNPASGATHLNSFCGCRSFPIFHLLLLLYLIPGFSQTDSLKYPSPSSQPFSWVFAPKFLLLHCSLLKSCPTPSILSTKAFLILWLLPFKFIFIVLT